MVSMCSSSFMSGLILACIWLDLTVSLRLTYFTATSSANLLVSFWFDGFVAVNLLHLHFFGKSACFCLI